MVVFKSNENVHGYEPQLVPSEAHRFPALKIPSSVSRARAAADGALAGLVAIIRLNFIIIAIGFGLLPH